MPELPKIPPGVDEVFLELMENPVSFLPAVARLCGSATAGLMLSQAIFWSRTKKVVARDGWFWKSAQEWQEETCLSVREQMTAREALRGLGFLSEYKKKVDGAPTIHYRVNFRAIIDAFLQNGNCGNAISEIAETQYHPPDIAKKENDKSANSYKEAETTPETTRDYQRGEQARPLSPVLVVDRSKLGEAISRCTLKPGDLDYDRQMFRFILRNRGGLTPTQAKEYLGEDPEWRKWPFWDVLDSQEEITFPESAGPCDIGSGDAGRALTELLGISGWQHQQSAKEACETVKRRKPELRYTDIPAFIQSLWREYDSQATHAKVSLKTFIGEIGRFVDSNSWRVTPKQSAAAADENGGHFEGSVYVTREGTRMPGYVPPPKAKEAAKGAAAK